MDAELSLVKMWSDEDMLALRLEISDGTSAFCNEVYVGHGHLKDTVAELDRFKDRVHGGIYDMQFGKFGPEYASGAFHARLHFENGSLYITLSAQSRYFDVGKKQVASESTLYLTSEPAQLDDFIRALRALSDGYCDKATLGAAPPW